MRFLIAVLCIVVVALPAAAQRQPSISAAADPLESLYACVEIRDDAQRLACQDSAIEQLRTAQMNGDLVAVHRTQADEIRREAFGFSLPSLPRLFDREDASGESADRSDDFAEVRLELASVEHHARRPTVFTMTNGQVWVQVDSENTRFARAGGSVIIRRAALGSYLMLVSAGGSPIRVRRQQ